MKKDWMITESELDDDQLRVLMSILDKSMVVTGCAGSGKSVLALMKAQRLQQERGDDYEVIVYTKALRAYMDEGRRVLGLTGRFTYFWWWENRLGCPSADYVIVDEAQDFTEEELRAFIRAARKHFYFFGDTAQSIYSQYKDTVRCEDIGYLVDRAARPKEAELYRNYRLPLPVARLAQEVGVDLLPFDEKIYQSKYRTGRYAPYVLRCRDLREQVDVVCRELRRPGLDDAAILCATNDEVDAVHELLQAAGLRHELKSKTNGDTLSFSSDLPKVMTVHSAKGLQFDTVFVVSAETYLDDDQRRVLYVAMTRACRYLYLLHSGPLPGYFPAPSSGLYKTSLLSSTIQDI